MKKGISNILVLVLVLVNLILTVILVFTFVPQINKTNNLVNKICDIIDLNVGDNSVTGDEVTLADLDSRAVKFGTGEEALSEITVTLSPVEGDSKAHHMKLSVILNLNKKHKDYAENSKQIDTAMSNIGTTIVSVVSNYTYTEVNREKMETDILQALRTLFNSDFIYSVEFSQWQVQ
ncbi:MAG: flagellar basal body-associated FliL family protein [Butyrivibrio sp.]|nr:flagellar basal body-associated FliL family protein [Butyrivibrio sp.]